MAWRPCVTGLCCLTRPDDPARRPARRVAAVETEDELVEAVASSTHGEPLLVLGGGSNVVAWTRASLLASGAGGAAAASGSSPDACSGASVSVAAGRTGTRWSRVRSRRLDRDRGARRDSRGRPARHRSRTSGPTARRSPRRSLPYGPGTARSGRRRKPANADCRFTYRHSRFKGSAPVRRARRLFPAASRRSCPSAEVRRAGPDAGVSAPASARRPVTFEPLRCWTCGVERGWSSTLKTTTPGAAELVLHQSGSRRETWLRRSPADAPRWPRTRCGRVKVSAAWLIEKAGFAKGYGSGAGAPFDETHAGLWRDPGNATTAGTTGAGPRHW